jgi:hypothetical protein
MEGGNRMTSGQGNEFSEMKAAHMEEQRDRVRAYSPETMARRVDQNTFSCLEALSDSNKDEITRHTEELAREWDVERYLQVNASILSLTGVILGATKNKKWLILPGIVFPFLLQHALQGWCPPMPVFRRMGVRTRKEINREKYALKALRGDFEAVSKHPEEAARMSPNFGFTQSETTESEVHRSAS